MMSLLDKFHEGGIFMWVILAFFIFTIGFIFERSKALFRKTKPIPAEFRNKILTMLGKGDFSSAEKYAESISEFNGVGRVIAVGCHLRESSGGDEEVQARMDEALASEITRLDQRTGFLAMFGNVATLVGLLGTIVGMIKSFAAVAAANPSDRATLLSQGIAEAMNCTAFGLMTAVPALVAYAIFQNRTDKITAQMTEVTTQIYNDLIFLTEPDFSAIHGDRSERKKIRATDALTQAAVQM